MDAFHNSSTGISEFGFIIYCCKDICQSFAYVNVSFVKRQGNEVSHVLARLSRFYASPMVCMGRATCVC